MEPKNIYDITILGGGPTGLFAAFYAGLRNASCKIIDSLPALGGRLTAVYPEKHIYDVAGFPKVLARDLVTNLVAQIEPYKTEIVLNEAAQSLIRQDDGTFLLETDKQQHWTRTVIIAAGVGSYKPKKHTAPGAEEFEGKGIEYAVLEKERYRGKHIVIMGGGDSALDWANELHDIAASVTLIHRSDKFRAHADSVEKLKKTSTRILLHSEVILFHGFNHLESVRVKNIETNEEETLPCDAALVMFGFNSALGRIKEWGLELHNDAIRVNDKMETNIPGVYAAGDITEYDAKLKLIVTGFSEAAIAANFAKNFMNPKEKVQPLHSTTIMEVKERKERRGLAT